ncbi:hypothetical protein [Pedococcus sp. P5_B7]
MQLKKVLVVGAMALALVGNGSAAWGAPRGDDAQVERIIEVKTGQVGQAVPPSGLERGGHKIKPAKGLKTWVQTEGSNVRLVARLTEGQSSGVFEDVVPEDWTIHEAVDGAFDVRDADGRATGTRILAPWAVDAVGRALPTHFEVRGQSLRQVVDTTDAVYPVVMDPTVTSGWYYFTPVAYIKFNWSETWKLKAYINDNRTLVAGLICNFLPDPISRTTCQAIFILVRADIISTVDSAIAHGKCYKVRMPTTGGAAGLAAYDSYYVTC